VTRVATNSLGALAWALLLGGLFIIALNPGVPSIPYALSWLGVVAVVRAASTLAPRRAVAIDLLLIFCCLVGMEFGGLILLPSVVAFALADAYVAGHSPTAKWRRPAARR
jgi:hypothetical protein